MAPLAEELLSNPVTLAVITAIIIVLVVAQSKLGPNIDWFWKGRRVLFPIADRVSRDYGRAWTREKDADDIDEYVFSTEVPLAEVDVLFHAAGYDPNGLATLKYVVIDGLRVYEVRSFVWRESLDAEDQTHAYVFDWGGARHCWQHVEPNNTDPGEHHHGEQTPGDPAGRLADAFEGVETYIDGTWVDSIG